MGGRCVEVEPDLLRVFPVVPLAVREPEEALLEDRIATVPQGEGKAQPSLTVAQAEEPVFAPAIGTASRMIMGEIFPAAAVGGVVLAHRSPLTLGKVGTPALPVLLSPRVFEETLGLTIRLRTPRIHSVRALLPLSCSSSGP